MRPVSFVRTSPNARDRSETAGYDNPLSLDAWCVRHPEATYFMHVGSVLPPLEEYYVRAGDLLVVDRAAPLHPGGLVVVAEAGELRLAVHGDARERRDEAGDCWGGVVALARRL